MGTAKARPFGGAAGKAVDGMFRAMEVLGRVNRELLGTAGIILMHVAQNPDTSIADLERKTDFVSRSAMYHQLALLMQNKGKGEPGLDLVRQYDDTMDRRIKRLTLTDKGEKLVEKVAKELT